jgi:hypothetical protein
VASKIESNSPFTIHNSELPQPERLSPGAWTLNPVSSTTPLTILAYLLALVKRQNAAVKIQDWGEKLPVVFLHPFRPALGSVSSVTRKNSTQRPLRSSVVSVLRLRRVGEHGEARFGCGHRAGIADFRLPIDPAEAGLIGRGGSCHITSSIDNRQSVIGNENLVFGCGYAALCPCG